MGLFVSLADQVVIDVREICLMVKFDQVVRKKPKEVSYQLHFIFKNQKTYDVCYKSEEDRNDAYTFIFEAVRSNKEDK